jgi:hypothetical protein
VTTGTGQPTRDLARIIDAVFNYGHRLGSGEQDLPDDTIANARRDIVALLTADRLAPPGGAVVTDQQDRLAVIKARRQYAPTLLVEEDADWLVAEVERLRRFPAVWAVRYGNYEPYEVIALYDNEDAARKHAHRDARPLEVEEVEVRSDPPLPHGGPPPELHGAPRSGPPPP